MKNRKMESWKEHYWEKIYEIYYNRFDEIETLRKGSKKWTYEGELEKESEPKSKIHRECF